MDFLLDFVEFLLQQKKGNINVKEIYMIPIKSTRI